MRVSQDLPSRLSRLLFTGVMTLAWSGGIVPSRAAPSTPLAAAASVEAEQVDRLLQAIEAAAREQPRDSFDPQAVLEKVGRDPAKLFNWVRDHTHWVAYRGALRGSTGVLMDRVGNSLDRSMLLADLLAASGQVVRLAHASLPVEKAAELQAKVRPLPHAWLDSVAAADASPSVDDLIAQYAGRFGLDGAELQANQRRATVEAARQAEQGVQRTLEQAPALAASVAGVVKPAAVDEKARQAKAMQDHWWVQQRDGEKWIDMDPLLSDAQPATSHATPAQTFNVPATGARPAADLKFWHEIDVRVIAERSVGGRISSTSVLAHTLRPAELYGQDITLAFTPTTWPKDFDNTPEKDRLSKIKASVLAQTEWIPILMVGKAKVAQKSIKDTGEVNEAPGGDGAGQVGNTVGQALGGFGGGLVGGDAEPAATAKSHLTAQWIEYEIRSPGEAPLKFRRDLFDLVGPGDRAAGKFPVGDLPEKQRLHRGMAMLGRTDMLPLGCRMSPAFVEHLTARRLASSRSAYVSMLKETWKGPTELTAKLAKAEALPGPTYALAMARDAWSPHAGDIYLDRPNLFTYHSAPRMDGTDGILMCAGFDIVQNDVAVRPGVADPFAIKLWQGVCDTNAEGLLVGGCGKVQNTAELFALASVPGGQWVTIKDPASANWNALGVSPDVRARMEQDLAAGHVIVAPKGPLAAQSQQAYAWWRVDPETGQTLGIGQSGQGASTAEYAVTLAYNLALGALCITIAWADKDGATVKDILACTFATVAGGGGMMMAVHGGSYFLTSMFLATAASIGVGLDKNKSVPDE